MVASELPEERRGGRPVSREGDPPPSAVYISTATVFAGLIGRPVRHSLSPRLHNAAFEALGLDWAYLGFDVEPARLKEAVAGAAALGMRGLSVTMPHKEEAARLAERRSRTVRRLAAANTLTFEDDGVHAESTDGEGFLRDLSSALAFEPDGRRCAVVGAGGAARAVILALVEAGAREVLVIDRTAARAFRAAALAGSKGRIARAEDLDSADLVVQATPFGMAGTGEEPLPGRERPDWPAGADPGRLGAGQIAVDLIYEPRETDWLREAAQCGAATRNGLGMLVQQAALQVTRWTGQEAPLEAMWAAVDEKYDKGEGEGEGISR
jgi:shikimate dehydrogenase